MQYIQFQPQIGSQIPTPVTGTSNTFVDATDNFVKTKIATGDIIGGFGGTITETFTKFQMDVFISGASLTTGQFYKITGTCPALYGGTDIILQAESSTKLSKVGIGFFYNPVYANPASGVTGYTVWNNADRIKISGITGNCAFGEVIKGTQGQIGTLVGIPGTSSMTFINTGNNWSTVVNITGQTSGAIIAYSGYVSAATYTVSDKVIWGGKVWQNLTSSAGTTVNSVWPASQVGLDNTNWSAVTYNTVDYNLVADTIEYDYERDNIAVRKSKFNEVRSDYTSFVKTWGYNNINRFPWGHPSVTLVKIENAYLEGIVNFPNYTGSFLTNVSVQNSGGFTTRYIGWGTQISGVTADKGAYLASLNLGDNTILSNITIDQIGSVNDLYTANNDSLTTQVLNIKVGPGSRLDHLFIHPSSFIKNITIGANSQMSYNYLYTSTDMYNITVGNNAFFGNNSIFSGSEVYNISTRDNSTFQNILGNSFSPISKIELGVGAYFGDITFSNGYNEISNIKLDIDALFQNITLSSSFANIKFLDLGVDANFTAANLGNTSLVNFVSIGNNAYINGLSLGNNAILQYAELGVNSNINLCSINNSTELNNINIRIGASLNNITFTGNVSSAYLALDSSTFPASVSITNSGSINLGAYPYAGLITLTSANSAETIVQIISGASFTQTFQPTTGLTVNYLGTPVSGVTLNGQMIMPVVSATTFGKTYDYISFDTVVDGAFTLSRLRDSKKYI